MARQVLIAFDDIVHGTSNVYSSAFVELDLAAGEAYAIQAVVDAILGWETTSFAVQLETSADGRNWQNKNASAEIAAVSIAAGQTKAAYAFDVGVSPALALVRVRVALTGSNPAAHVRVYVRQTSAGCVTPGAVPGCLLWLRSDLGVTKNASNAVSKWADQSGSGNDASQSTGARQPIWTPNQLNGLPTLNFDGAAQYLATPAFSLGVYTVMMVCTKQVGTNGFFWIRSTGATGVDTLYGDVFCTAYCDRGTGTQSCRDYVIGWGQNLAAGGHVLMVQMNGTIAGHTLRIDGGSNVLTTHAGYGDPGTGSNSYKFCIAARDDASLFAKTNVAEVAVFNNVLGFQHVTALEEYARRRYLLY